VRDFYDAVREDEAKAAMFDGRDARREGRPHSANPHPEGTSEHSAWFMGWRIEDGRRESIREAA
jgi:hypothetical protein